MFKFRFIISYGFVFALCLSMSAEYAELRDAQVFKAGTSPNQTDEVKNEFNKLGAGSGISQNSGATGNQFKSAVFFGSSFYGKSNSESIEPQSVDGFKLKQTRVGQSFFGRVFQYQFGQVIAPPLKDVSGSKLSSSQSVSYWKARPYNSDKALIPGKPEYGRFYWSEGAEKVYATRPGPVEIVWERTQEASSNPIAGNGWSVETISSSVKIHTRTVGGNITETWREENTVFYQQYTDRIIVSGTTVKPPRTIYWTGNDNQGFHVIVPNSRITGINVVFNEAFPENVPVSEGTPFFESGAASSEGTSAVVVQTRTLWYSKVEGVISALNKEGRVFLELLGPINPVTGKSTALGFEIVDVVKHPKLERAYVELGDELPVLEPIVDVGAIENLSLIPYVSNLPEGKDYVYENFDRKEADKPTLHAIKETKNATDLIIWWLIEGNQGIRWPERYVSYDLKWPAEPDRYSHYIRPSVDSEKKAAETSVLLPASNFASIVYQDDNSSKRAVLVNNRFYTYLDSTFPAHRSLLKFSSQGYVKFERVFSWLDSSLKDKTLPKNNITQTIGVTDSLGGSFQSYYNFNEGSSTEGTISFPVSTEAPRLVSETVYVGSRISAPSNELGSGADEEYIAGKIISGTSYHEGAYVDPVNFSFSESNKGAIIPVNSIPNKNEIKIIWYRKNTQNWIKGDDSTRAQLLNEQRGFETVYWPAVVGTYTIKWPHENPNFVSLSKGNTIVMASNAGSGPLNSIESKGSVYFQNDSSLIGYNPNEEHAIMLGGQVYALRDDLNLTNAVGKYSSDPYVLLYYTGADERPAMRPFKVSQELGDIKFNYDVVAGTILQAPMPLPLMQKLKDNDEFNGESIVSAELIAGKPYMLKLTLEKSGKFSAGDVIDLRGFNEAGNNGWALVEEIVSPTILNVTRLANPDPASIESITFGSNLIPAGSKDDDSDLISTDYYKLILPNYGDEYFYTKGANEDYLYNADSIGGTLYDDRKFTKSSYFKGVDQHAGNTSIVIIKLKENLEDVTADIREAYTSKNEISIDAKYSEANGNFYHYIPDLKPGLEYEYTKGANDTLLFNGPIDANPISESGKFTANNDYVWMKGDGVKKVTAVIRLAKTSKGVVKTKSAHGFDGSNVRIITENNWSNTYKISISDSTTFTIEAPEGEKKISKGLVYELPNTLPIKGAIAAGIRPNARLQEPTESGDYTNTTIMDRKNNIWVYRGAHNLSGQEDKGAKFKISYYYKTLEGFWFPELAAQPQVGTVVPYLKNDINEAWPSSSESYVRREAKGISYNAVWPENVAELRPGQTLTSPVFGLPAVRGNTSLKILYQESTAKNENHFSATLHDPTREKIYDLKTGEHQLYELPAELVKMNLKGKTYFPHLSPHLVKRFFFDPNRGALGQLVFLGEYIDEIVGEDYLLLNVVSANDLAELEKLADPNRGNEKWNSAIGDLVAKVETFKESAVKRGSFIPDESKTNQIKVDSLVEITSDETAVDSYALSANGSKEGYVTLIAGDGQAFTPKDEPVQMHIIKVSGPLYRGESKVILSDNPLAEKVTLLHTGDLAGRNNDFEYDWRIAAPEDGLPPAVSEKTLINGATAQIQTTNWKHLRSIPKSGRPQSTGDAKWLDTTIGGIIVQDTSGINSIELVSDAEEKSEDANGLDSIYINTISNSDFQKGDLVNLSGFFPDSLNLSGLTIQSVDGKNIQLEIDSIANLNPVQTIGVLEESLSAVGINNPASILSAKFNIPAGKIPSDMFLSFSADSNLSLKIKINKKDVVSYNMNKIKSDISDTPTSVAPTTFSPLENCYLVDLSIIKSNASNDISIEFWSGSDPGANLPFNLKIESKQMVDKVLAAGSKWLTRKSGNDLRAIIIGENADVQALSDNYLVMRYRSSNASHLTRTDSDGNAIDGWSRWTEPQLAEGWIKRVLAGINPFGQRVNDLYSNAVDTSGSILTQAGKRWEGDVALNMQNINDFGLIEIYETVMGRGKMLSIDAGIDYGPANDALLLAAGYINDLYMIYGNEAWADAANPTIGIGTKDKNYGSVSTALFAFKGQLPSLLEEELALLRGRDDFLQPGVETGPVYNKLFWNYTRGIDSGEIVYALNYNIQEDNDSGYDGKVNAADAAKMYPQGHGDAYGHYLTALKGYYKLLIDNDFTWVPRTEAVTVLGKPVQVDYLDERKFATAAAALARTGKQVVDLTWRKDYNSDKKVNWEKEFYPSRENNRRSQTTTREWGLDHWATRTGQGSLINWVVGNAMLPEVDLDPNHDGIQRIDRSTVPELSEISSVFNELQVAMDNAEAGLNPLGLNEDSLLMDLNPMGINGSSSHFDLVLARAENALNNAAVAFDDTKDLTQLMREEADSLAELQADVEEEELAYKYELIELYGTPYPDDIGPGKTYSQGYNGPDLYHYMYTDTSRLNGKIEGVFDPDEERKFKIDLQTSRIDFGNYSAIKKSVQAEAGVKGIWQDLGRIVGLSDHEKLSSSNSTRTKFHLVEKNLTWDSKDYHETNYINYTLSPNGLLKKPASWASKRSSPGEIQMAINAINNARDKVDEEMESHELIKYMLDREIEVFEANVKNYDSTSQLEILRTVITAAINKFVEKKRFVWELANMGADQATDLNEIVEKAIPDNMLVGLATGGQLAAPAEAAAEGGETAAKLGINVAAVNAYMALDIAETFIMIEEGILGALISMEDRELEVKELILPLDLRLKELNMSLYRISEALNYQREAYEAYRALKAKGLRIQDQRERFRMRTAAITQGIRTRDAAFRVFRNEKLERYKALQDMASKYAFLAAQSYDYETGLLGTDKGRKFINKIINSRALGVIVDGEPQFAGSDTGDPGISSALAEMKNDWQVVQRRLGFNNPDLYSTIASLRSGKNRILPGRDGALEWGDILEGSRMKNILNDNDVRLHCMQIGYEDQRPVPGLVIEFATTIEKGKNVFGLPLSGGDSQFSSTSFSTKIFSVGIALEGYVGMSAPNSNDLGGSSPSNPTPSWLDPKALSKTPYVYLIPVGLDYMRSPALGDTSQIRRWNVKDVAIPLPFNIGGSEHSSKKLWQSSESLTDELFSLRKHQPFRAVDDAGILEGISITNDQTMNSSNYTNRRLVGRSVWNNKWKLVIPGDTLLKDPEEGLDRFIQTVNDIKIYFNTYSYSGN